ncbi:MAG: YHS domain-containing protein [Deltaproteobacteria bacterium]|nr:MAG: YHS domain-containing protein [Deltaproteobacteria bacterium]
MPCRRHAHEGDGADTTAEYQGKTYYCCNKADKQACLQDPEPYAKGKSAE